ncbi:ribonuclease HIII [Coraliomargarita sp. SDUM461004]|uniref:Ribonuclease n=1 Tax=Thalassobacterium sedimentorum TaxID=3041258 RepID=A0ABU1AJQ8_9BACT|nr:ribonuclease HIII [Coraliomargarita sp. SDUM461004]MDQ8195054.1 ribonuclease HIII [Coraliomargarita sp. SDUM461004]
MPKKKSKLIEDEGPKKKVMYTLKLDDEKMDQLADLLEAKSGGEWSPYDVAYSLFAFKGEKVNVVGYQSGKLVVSGKNTEDFVRDILEAQITGDPRLGYDEVHNPEWFTLHAGCDESGKGDLFGPLVTACVVADGEMVRHWLELGVADSKKLTDGSILKLDKEIRQTKGVVIQTAFARMPKYNELYNKFGRNLNKLLAWYHGKSLNQALDERSAPWGLLDQFTKQKLVDAYVKDRKDFNLVSRTKAESDPVVAAASIVARAVYVREMKRLSDEIGEPLVKGASGQVLAQAKKIVAEKGADALKNYAKMHFKTAYEAQGLEPPAKPSWYKY